MTHLKTVALGLVAFALAGGSALAQDTMMKGDSMGKMSSKDMKMMTTCKGMDHDMMMKNKKCMKMMKMHPDMMKDDGMMKH